MSKASYIKAKNWINENPNDCFILGPRKQVLIAKAEIVLDLKFSPQHKDFLMTYGALSVGAEEVYGVVDEDFTDSAVPNGVWFTLIERDEIGLPEDLFVLFDTGADEHICLNYGELIHNEPSVVVYYPGFTESAQTYEKVADDLGDYLLGILEKELI